MHQGKKIPRRKCGKSLIYMPENLCRQREAFGLMAQIMRINFMSYCNITLLK